jgi:hypothetical protein
MSKDRKFATAAIRKISDDVETTRYIEFVASDNSRDSYKTVLPVDKWDLDRFNKNGVIGYQHALYYSTNPDMVIGSGKAFVEDGKLIIGITFEPADLNPIAEKLFRKTLHGTIKAVSVGFDPIGQGAWGVGDQAAGKENQTYYYAGQELLEISIVHIPSNKNALKRALEDLLIEDDDTQQTTETRQTETSETVESTETSEETNQTDDFGDRFAETYREMIIAEAECCQFLV